VPVASRIKLQALTRDLGTQAGVARLLGVSPSRVSRWLKTEEPDLVNRRKLDGLELILQRLLDLYEQDAALKWLEGFNAHLGNRRPIDLLAMGRVAEVLQAVEAAETGAYS